MTGLVVEGIKKRYGARQILKNIYVNCNKGEIIGLFGTNGTGKSTLLKIISGRLDAEQKHVTIDNKPIPGLFKSRHLINYIPQDTFLPGHIKFENIIPLYCDKSGAEKINNNQWLQSLIDKKISTLSEGEKRIIEIILIIYSSAGYTLIDEPFNRVSPIGRELIKDILKEQSKNKGFIITDHDYSNILDLSTRIIHLHDGITSEISNPEELKYFGYISG